MNGDETSGLLANCHQIMEDIPICQDAGKKVFLSLGGSAPASGQYIASKDSAYDFADWIWGAFGPVTSEWTAEGLPRPFGDVVFDGFDLDIEWGTGFGMYKLILDRNITHYRDRIRLPGEPPAPQLRYLPKRQPSLQEFLSFCCSSVLPSRQPSH